MNRAAVGRLSDECVQQEVEEEEEGATITMAGRSGSGIWMPCLSTGPDKDDSSSSLSDKMTRDHLLVSETVGGER